MKKIGGITKRWLKDIFSVILVLVLSVSVAACLFIRTYYYTSIKNVLETNSGELITTFFNIYGANSEDGFAIAGREFIENCGMLDLMEIWIIDNSGNVLLSMNTDGSAAGAIRYIVSLEDVDSQIGFSCLIIGLIAAVIIAVSTILGLVFTRSIVRPLRNIGNVAGKVADGDLSARIENHKYDDEIGELCGKINNMIDELNDADRLKNDFISTISHEGQNTYAGRRYRSCADKTRHERYNQRGVASFRHGRRAARFLKDSEQPYESPAQEDRCSRRT